MNFLRNSFWVTFPLIAILAFFSLSDRPWLWKSTHGPTICEFDFNGPGGAAGEPLGSGAPIQAYQFQDSSGLILESYGRLPEIGTKFKYRSIYTWESSVYIVSRGVPCGERGNRVYCERLWNYSHADVQKTTL